MYIAPVENEFVFLIKISCTSCKDSCKNRLLSHNDDNGVFIDKTLKAS